MGAVLLVSACASLPPPQARTISTAHVDVASTLLARIAAASGQGAAPGLSGFQLMPEGPTALNARLALARHAQKTIDAQY